MASTLTKSMQIAGFMKQAADDLYWCTRERYTADGIGVLKGGNELISLYTRPKNEDAVAVAEGLNALIGPMRKRRVEDLVDKLRAMADELMKTDY